MDKARKQRQRRITDKLKMWQDRLAVNEVEWESVRSRFDAREELYRGRRRIDRLTAKDVTKCGTDKETPHVRNIVAEIIEAQVNSTIPQPKVTARRKEDEPLAKIVEDMLRDELNRLPMEQINDMQERTVPIQGGTLYLVEWDSTKRTQCTAGDIVISAQHPKRIVPQAGVYSSIEDMDYIFLKVPQTKEYIKRRYGVDLQEEAEESPEVRGMDSEQVETADLVTQVIAYYRNSKGGIGRYSWVNDTELEDMEDYQARRLRRCKSCGALEPPNGAEIARKLVQMDSEPTADEGEERQREAVAAMIQRLSAEAMGIPTEIAAAPAPMPMGGAVENGVENVDKWRDGDPCPYCGADDWQEGEEDYQEIYNPIITEMGNQIPGAVGAIGPTGVYLKPTRIPVYKPNCFPLVLQRNTSLFGQLLGDSDVDKIEDQQNTLNRMELKMIDRIVKSGTRITLPDRADIRLDPEDGEKILIANAQDKALIDVYQFEGDVSPIMAYMSQVYEEARQTIGITDSFQGRQDSSAQSGVAKQFAAAQSAGRLESKRIMKDAAYADLFKMIFQFKLAYADEPRPIVTRGKDGAAVYESFDRYDFLKQDPATGEWYWNDDFLFATDTSAPLANNRERMWQETLQLFQAGTFGDPTDINTLVALWTKMELLHYPGASDTLQYMQERQKRMEAQQAAMMQQQMMMEREAMRMEERRQMTAAAQNQIDKEAAVRDKAIAAASGGINGNQ